VDPERWPLFEVQDEIVTCTMVRRNRILSGLIASATLLSAVRGQTVEASDLEIGQFLTSGRVLSSSFIGQGVTNASELFLSTLRSSLVRGRD
jgi:hypothetical protein